MPGHASTTWPLLRGSSERTRCRLALGFPNTGQITGEFWLGPRAAGARLTGMHRRSVCVVTVLVVGLVGCGESSGVVDGDADGGGGMCIPREASVPDAGACTPAASDYAPCADDGYDGCISDDGKYHQIEPTVSSIARVGAFEEMAELLFDPSVDPSSKDFQDAAFVFEREDGLGSRVERRYDPHFDSQSEGTKCDNVEIIADDPDYCVGAGQLYPIVDDALAAGFNGDDPRANAGRIEAALLWFFYVSSYKEGTTCAVKPKDCDSAYSYYTGAGETGAIVGLAARIKAVDPIAHRRALDGLLALRCWRDLDDAEMAKDTAMRDRARAQYDRAVLDGMAAIVIDRLSQLENANADEARYHASFLAVIGRAFDRALREMSPADADALAAELARPADELDAAAVSALLVAAFECP